MTTDLPAPAPIPAASNPTPGPIPAAPDPAPGPISAALHLSPGPIPAAPGPVSAAPAPGPVSAALDPAPGRADASEAVESEAVESEAVASEAVAPDAAVDDAAVDEAVAPEIATPEIATPEAEVDAVVAAEAVVDAIAVDATVAVVGASGAVGAGAVRALWRAGVRRIRLGGRDPRRLKRLADELGPPASAHRVDLRDRAALDRFVAGAALVLTCAGPRSTVGDRVARAALRAGADYVDASGDDPLVEALASGVLGARAPERTGRVVACSAGLKPGLTALLPRWLAAREFDDVTSLWSCLAVLDRLTPAAARDYLRVVADGHSRPGAAWRRGRRRAALTRRTGVRVPHLPRRADLRPHLDVEGERLAAALGLARGDWYTAVVGEHMAGAFDRVGALDADDAADALCRASALDLAGRNPSVTLLVRLDGTRDGHLRTRTAVLRAAGNTEVTGAVAAVTALAVLEGRLPPGRHAAGEALDPGWTLDRLRTLTDLRVRVEPDDPHEPAGDDAEEAEEGTL